MKIIVCVKIVIDPEAPASLFKVDTEGKRVIPPKGTPPVMNPFDENALEAALKIKDCQASSVTVLSMGKNIPKPIIKKSLATGADSLILLEDDSFDDLDSYCTANILVCAIQKLGEYDLIICGREAADSDAGQVGLGIAEILGIPSVSLARNIVASDNKVTVERITMGGYETIEVPLPALITASSEIGNLRTASLLGIMAAQKKPLTIWNAQQLGIAQPPLKRTNLFKLFQPVRENNCQIIAADTPENAGVNLANSLRANRVL